MYATLPDSYRDYIRYLFDDSRTKIVCDVIKAMEIEIHNNTYDEDLLNRFSNQVGIPSEYVDLLLTDMLGWVTQTVESFTKDNKPAYISAADYRKALNAQIRAYNTNAVLRAVSRAPSRIEQSGEVERLDTYIRQLQLVEVDDTTLYEAASDFLRAKVDKIEWAQRGIVHAQSFEDYRDALYRIWTNQNSFWDCNTEQIPSLVVKQYISSAETILHGKSYRALRFLHFLVAVHYRTWQTILLIRRKLDGILSI